MPLLIEQKEQIILQLKFTFRIFTFMNETNHTFADLPCCDFCSSNSTFIDLSSQCN